jgi:hypothetical protein
MQPTYIRSERSLTSRMAERERLQRVAAGADRAQESESGGLLLLTVLGVVLQSLGVPVVETIGYLFR